MKKTTRIKAPVILTREEFEIIVERVAIHSTRLRELEAARDDAIQTVQKSFAPEVSRLNQYIEADAALCEKYAEEHRAELLPGKAKSAETPLARFGFRLGNPTLKTLAKWTWEKVIEVLDGPHPEYVRLTPTVDKETILGDHAKNIIDAGSLARYGMRVVQAETFFIEPKVEGAEAVKARGAA